MTTTETEAKLWEILEKQYNSCHDDEDVAMKIHLRLLLIQFKQRTFPNKDLDKDLRWKAILSLMETGDFPLMPVENVRDLRDEFGEEFVRVYRESFHRFRQCSVEKANNVLDRIFG